EALALEAVDHAARGALVQVQVRGEVVEGERAALDQGFQRVALRDRDVVAADAVAVAELVDADQVGQRPLERGRITGELRVAAGRQRGCRQRQRRPAGARRAHVVLLFTGAARSSCMTTAVSGHAPPNSAERCTAGGTSARSIAAKPKRGKKSAAVVVRRYTACAPPRRASASAASVSRTPSPRLRHPVDTTADRSSAFSPCHSRPIAATTRPSASATRYPPNASATPSSGSPASRSNCSTAGRSAGLARRRVVIRLPPPGAGRLVAPTNNRGRRAAR